MKTFICIRKSDRHKFVVKARDVKDLLDLYDISEEYFEITEET